ncbi:MAG: hypothetical protein HYX74_07515 [Acidobacteria bacterium]|nr:hypothetical protein [Acidobacteriota bacterium]
MSDASVISEAERFLNAESVEAQEEAIHYLCANAAAGARRKMQEFLMSGDHGVRAAAIACMANCGGVQGAQMAQSMFEEMLSRPGDQALEGRKLLARALRHIKPPSPLHSHLGVLLQDPRDDVAREALAAARHVLRREFVPLIVAKLADPGLAPIAMYALKTYGDKILGTLRDILADDAVSTDVRRLLPSVFVEVGTENAARDLAASLGHPDSRLHYEIIKALNKIRDRHPELEVDRSAVEQALIQEIHRAYDFLQELYVCTSAEPQDESGADQIAVIGRLTQEHRHCVERIFRLLGLLFSQRDIYSAYRGLNSPRLELRTNATELLDNLLQGHLKKMVLPLVDDEIPIQDKLRIGSTLLGGVR